MSREEERGYPKSPRFFLMRLPGTTKSSSSRAITEVLRNIIVDYDDVIKQATPTGCTSFQMAGNATTVHKLFGLHIKSKVRYSDE